MESLDGGECPVTFFRVGLGFFERFLARADCLGEPVLIEFGRLRLPPQKRHSKGLLPKTTFLFPSPSPANIKVV